MIVVKESKFPLLVGIISGIIFTLLLIFSLSANINEGHWIVAIFCSSVFGGFDFLSLYLILDYYNRKLILYDDHFTYTHFLGKTTSHLYSHIQCIEEYHTQSIEYKMISHDGKKLGSFENNMLNSTLAVSLLKEKGILFCQPDPSRHIFVYLKNVKIILNKEISM